MKQSTVLNIVRSIQFFFALSLLILGALTTHFGGWITLHTWHNLGEIHFLVFDGAFMILSILFILMAQRIKIIETEMRLAIFAIEFLNQGLIFAGFILLSVSFGTVSLNYSICYRSYYQNQMVTCHLAQTTTAVSAVAWVCWVATSVMTFQGVLKAHKAALAKKAIGLEEQAEETQLENYTDQP